MALNIIMLTIEWLLSKKSCLLTKKVRLSLINLKGVCQSSSGLMVKSLLAMASIGFCINRTHFDRKLQRLRVRFREIRSVSRNRKTVPVSSNRQTSRKNGLFRCNRYSRLEHPFFLLFFVKINHIIIIVIIFLYSYILILIFLNCIYCPR